MSPAHDELAIRDLVHRYCDGVNRRDEATWAAVWADEGASWELPGRRIEGKAEIVAFWKAAVAAFDTLVLLAPNGVLEIGDDSATGRWWVTEEGVRGGTGHRIVAAYHDTYVREGDAWRIASRRLEVVATGSQLP